MSDAGGYPGSPSACLKKCGRAKDKTWPQGLSLITEDKDFGQLVYASGHESVGVQFLGEEEYV